LKADLERVFGGRQIWPVHRRVCSAVVFTWPPLKPREYAEMIDLTTQPRRDVDGGIATWEEIQDGMMRRSVGDAYDKMFENKSHSVVFRVRFCLPDFRADADELAFDRSPSKTTLSMQTVRLSLPSAIEDYLALARSSGRIASCQRPTNRRRRSPNSPKFWFATRSISLPSLSFREWTPK